MTGIPGPPAAPTTPDAVPPLRRWIADPLLLLGGTALVAVVLGVLALSGVLAPLSWTVPALLAVVAAGLALSGST